MSPESKRSHWQDPIDTATKRVWDVLVVGAGPAGSIAALHLALRGYRVLLLDKQSFPRNKTCGDGLLPDALGVLERARLSTQVRQLGYTVHRASLFSPSGFECEFPWNFVNLKRALLDTLIARRAVDAGAVFCCGRVERLAGEPLAANCGHHPGLMACGLAEGGICHARVVVIATGADTTLSRQLGLVTRVRASGLAIRCYVHSKSGLDRMVISYDRSLLPAYAWIFPMGDGEYNVGCGILYRGKARDRTNLRKMFWQFARNFPLARDLLRQSVAMSPLQGAQLRCGLKGAYPCHPDGVLANPPGSRPRVEQAGIVPAGQRVPLRVMAVGEALGSTFPATMEGIGKAMQTAELAAEVIDEALRSGDLSRLHEYPARLEARFRNRYRGYEVAERWLCLPWLVDFVARRARKSKFLQEAIAGIFHETVDPRTIFSIQGIIKSFAG